jgi:vancomycin resistance protein VanW
MIYNPNLQSKPVERTRYRARLGMIIYGLIRRASWVTQRNHFAKKCAPPFNHLQFSHQTPLLRQLKEVDIKYQYNKIANLRIAAKKLDGLVIHTGEIFSYWNLIGNPTKRKGYLEGMVLHNGQVGVGIGGGLCQLSNLIYWMTLHTPLTVIERHRHGYDVFPDADRSQPFGSGATCCYPHVDLMIQNNTPWDFQLKLHVGDEFLMGEWRAETPPVCQYQVVEKSHKIVAEYWGGYTRSNQLFRRMLNFDGKVLDEDWIADNNAIMMYAPFIGPSTSEE